VGTDGDCVLALFCCYSDGLSFEQKDVTPVDAAAEQADEPAPMQ
jgi:hypothetical protein